MTKLEAALKYASVGIPVFPCEVGAKRPLGKVVPNGFKQASCSDSQIRIWWTRSPEANIGGRMGGHVLAVDADKKSGGMESIEQMQEIYDLFPPLPVQMTQSGGRHYLFKHPGGHVVSSPNAFDRCGFPGIDIRADDSYIVLWPSAVDGRPYEWEVDAAPWEQDLPDLPEWLRKMLELRTDLGFVEPGQRTGLPLGKPAEDFLAGRVRMGEQRLAAARAARNLFGAGYSLNDAIELIWSGMQRCDQNPEDPWQFSHAKQLTSSIYKSRAPKPAPMRNPEAKVKRSQAAMAAQAPPPPADPPPAEVKAEPEPKEFNLTDLGNAERLVDKFGANIRYCAPWDRWLTWDGKRWLIDKTKGAPLMRMAAKIVRGMYIEAGKCADSDDRKRIAKWAEKSESKDRLKAMIEIARSLRGVPVMPEDLDGDTWKFNVRNGTLDLRDGVLLPHTQEDLITKLVKLDYDPEAKAERWRRFVSEIVGDDLDLRNYLFKAVGWSMTGDTSIHALIFCYGGGSNGKSTFIEVLQEMFGEYGLTAKTDSFMVQQNDRISNDIAHLKGARFVAASESAEGKRLDEAKIKSITGGDTIRARFLYQEEFSFRPTHTLWMSGNHKPEIRGTDDGIWRRVHLVPFEQRFPAAGEPGHEEGLKEKLLMELPGVLAWAVEGCREWRRCGLQKPDKIVAAVTEYRSEMDVIGAFLEECTEADQFDQVTPTALYNAYSKWAKLNGEFILSNKKFGTRMRERGHASKQLTAGIRYYTGIGLKEDWAGGSAYRGSSDD